jgi:cytochrome c-type biogenesis protein CcmH
MMSHKNISIESLIVFFIIILTSYFLLPTSYSTALAQEPDYDRVNEIAKNLNCPTCAGINLADCRTLTCEQWRDQINDLVKQGYTDEEVLNYFTTRYGTQVLQSPPKSGSTLLLWVLPVTILLAGGVWLIFALRKWAGREAVPEAVEPVQVRPASTGPQTSNHYVGQVEKDLNLGD